MTYVFRNNTIEQFFGTEYRFSGYDDLVVPQEDEYLWWFQIPVCFDTKQLSEIVRLYEKKLNYVISQIGTKTIYVFTLDSRGIQTIETSETELYTAIAEFNIAVYRLANKPNVKIVHIEDFLTDYAAKDIIDYRYYLTAQIPYNPLLIKPFQKWWKRKKEESLMVRKKCLVLDLDNTLWGGILGEDGVDGVLMSGSYPGRAFSLWQEGLKELMKNGVMLAICSKNNMADVEEVWDKRDDMVLKREDFVALRINWRDKATNIMEIGQELNIGLDSIVFVDDNPSERELIRQQLPGVSVVNFPDQPYGLMGLYEELVDKYFGVYSITNEDKEKTKQYIANAQRKQQQSTFKNIDDYLKSLEMKLLIERVNESTCQRVAQLTQKTNQFNLTTIRYSESDIQQKVENGADVWIVKVSDKFGDYGLTGVMIICDKQIESLLLSCRVLGKGVEQAFVLSVLGQYNKDYEFEARYLPTSKNAQVADFYDKLGFELLEVVDGVKRYKCRIVDIDLSVKSYFEINIK